MQFYTSEPTCSRDAFDLPAAIVGRCCERDVRSWPVEPFGFSRSRSWNPESTSTHFAVRGCFFAAGLLVGLGLWGFRARLPSKVAKVGATLTAVTAALVAVGFALGSFVGFVLVYVGQLFLIPLGMVILAVGLVEGRRATRVGNLDPGLHGHRRTHHIRIPCTGS